MKKETFIVSTDADLNQVHLYLHSCLQDQAPLEVVVHTATKSRSVQQNRLLWLWNSQIGNYMGLTKDEVHELLKRKFAKPIFIRDNLDYANMVEAVRTVYRAGMLLEAECLAKEIIRLTSTSDFTVDQAAEYLRDIEHYAVGIGVQLTFPEDLYKSL